MAGIGLDRWRLAFPASRRFPMFVLLGAMTLAGLATGATAQGGGGGAPPTQIRGGMSAAESPVYVDRRAAPPRDQAPGAASSAAPAHNPGLSNWIVFRWTGIDLILLGPVLRGSVDTGLEVDYMRARNPLFGGARRGVASFNCRAGTGRARGWGLNAKWQPADEPKPTLEELQQDVRILHGILCNLRVSVRVPRIDVKVAKQSFDAGARHAPLAGAREGYQLSIEDQIVPNGNVRTDLEPGAVRQIVGDDQKRPFSAIGRLYIPLGGNRAAVCSAFLVGNNMTLMTAAHCASPGGQYQFRLANRGRAYAAREWGRGDYTGGDFDSVHPNKNWDDWLILHLNEPVAGEPLSPPPAALMAKMATENGLPDMHLVGYPTDVVEGEMMVWARTCPYYQPGTIEHYKGTRLLSTECRAYSGASGSAIMAVDPDFEFVPVGILHGGVYRTVDGKTVRTLTSYVAVSPRAFERLREKLSGDCAAARPGVRFAPGACAR